MFKRIALALLFTVSIPLIGYFVSNWILNDYNNQLDSKITVQEFCKLSSINSNVKFAAICEEVNKIVLLEEASIWSGITAISLILLYMILAVISGKNRNLNAAIFPVLIPISTLVIAALVLVEGGILTYAAWVGEIHAIGQVHYFLIGAIGLGALFAAFNLIIGLFSIKSSLENSAFAELLKPEDYAKLWEFVRNISDQLGATRPDNIIVGLEPTFYATAAKTKLINTGNVLEGKTLFLSLPLMRLFDINELKSVVGHELGHFRGEDTAYSLKFAPVYAGLSKAIDTLSGRDGEAASITTLPALSMLSVMHELFSINERKISRDREFEADNAGVSVSSENALATALGKVAVYSHLWSNVRSDNVDRLNIGKVTSNLCSVFEDSAKYDVSHRILKDVIEDILQTQISHPTDTHPTIYERYKNIGYSQESLSVDDLINVGNSISELLDNHNEIEEELTLFEHRLMVALGNVTKPDEDEGGESDEPFLNAVYSLAAAMVGADGIVDQAEIQVAESLGKQLISSFDGVDFRDYCKNLDQIPDFKKVVEVLGATLSDKNKLVIYDYLKDIAYADGELADEEKELLVYTREEWALEV